jgi:hypothetical protein
MPLEYLKSSSSQNYYTLAHAEKSYKQNLIASMTDFIQARHAPGEERDDIFAAQFYDTMQEIHCGGSEYPNEEDPEGGLGNAININTTPTFYFYTAGGVELNLDSLK